MFTKTMLLSSNTTFLGSSSGSIPPKWRHQSSLFPYHGMKKYQHSTKNNRQNKIHNTLQAPSINGTVVHNPGHQERLQKEGNFGKLPEAAEPGSTLGRYLARRLVEIGVNDVFAVPGDSNLALLDQLLAEPGLNLVGCCNELNAGYAADGYARSRGIGVCVFTFTVGGLSALNAVAGAYSESLPLICIVGGPNSNYYGANATLLHHTIGLPDFGQELKCFEPVTCHQAVVKNLDDAHEQIDTAITTALNESKPVYISISCNLPGVPHPSFRQKPVPFFPIPRISNPVCLEAAVEAAAELLNKAEKPVLVGGPKLRIAKACEAFVELAEDCGYAVAVMPAAKGLVPENHPQFIGTFWGAASTPFCAEIMESADAYLYAGPIFDDINTVGYSVVSNMAKGIILHPERVVIGNNHLTFGGVLMKDFLKALSKRLQRKTSSDNYRLMNVPKEVVPLPRRAKEALKVNVLFRHIQKMLSSGSVVIADTGDSWFNCQKLKLPQGCGYEVQMHYASIGWSVGATLGYAQAAPDRRVIACIGDGSFQIGSSKRGPWWAHGPKLDRSNQNYQLERGSFTIAEMTVQEVSTMLRCGQRSIIFLINNGGYAIEEQIHEGPYNVIKNWDYTQLVNSIQNGEGNCWAAKVHCEEELVAAIDMAMGDKKDYLCFIEVIVHMHDTSKELMALGSRLAVANGSPPQ